jgi:hydroxymethylglutaryl-CoA reductase (NADPH)
MTRIADRARRALPAYSPGDGAGPAGDGATAGPQGPSAVPPPIPRVTGDDYSAAAVGARQAHVAGVSGARLWHACAFSFDPHLAAGHCENFTGVAQVPLGFAGPLRVDGEHARGEFLIPLATSEGTLVASYNRGIHALNRCGGVRCTVVADCMQRAPVFVFEDARRARDFADWILAREQDIRTVAEATSRVAQLSHIQTYLSNHMAFLRFNFETGDAAGQNMVTLATAAACAWILERFSGVQRFFLESNIATDKKTSHVNLLCTRGKRVTAEAVVARGVLESALRVRPEALTAHYRAATVGTLLAGANNNGLHAANALAALFIATGQDVANVAESSAGILYCEINEGGDLYISITLPSLIVATHGGGTGLPTQRECLAVLGCEGAGRARKLAEIVAGVVLAGELSLAAAIASGDWVSSHERMGRHR